MDVERDLVVISVPFAAGVAAAPLIGYPFALAGLSLACAAALLGGFALTRRHGRLFAALLFLCLGLLCAATDRIAPRMGQSDPAWTGAVLERLDGIIARIGFRRGETGGLIRALLTGRRDGLSRETVSLFRQSGASHLLALSGLHLGVIYLLLGRILSVLGNSQASRLLRSALLVGFCTLYAVLTGASPSIVRALIFVVFSELHGLLRHRRRSPAAVLCAALTLQLAVSPGVMQTLGFRLSYLAMTGIVTVYPVLERWYPVRSGLMHRIWTSAALAASCQIFTAPLVWAEFHVFPRYFLLTNLLALPLTEALMLCGVAALALETTAGCPDLLVRATEGLCGWLESCLEIIVSM
ncbi:MAG: ComEC/Rec2 family competence protein [Bacteroidales bacterium]|nr:ComEC/Rec2 family competence protein [Bacteroidales bacterium]